MPNPLTIAARGKGIFPMLLRGVAITNRYGITSAKIDRAMSQLSNTLKQFRCRATIPVTALTLSRNLNVARKYLGQGFELAIHGLSHVDYRSLSNEIQLDHIQRAQSIFEQAGIKVTGFRSPYLHWNEDTLAALRVCGFKYDSSQALDLGVLDNVKTGSYRQALEFYQAQATSQYPALPRQEADLMRIPYCLPDDEALLERLKITDCQEMTEVWLAMLERIYELGELFTLGLHPERAFLCQEALETVLGQARKLSPPVWIARLDEIAAWYETLGGTVFKMHRESDDWMHIKIQASSQATVLVRSLILKEDTEPWIAGYRRLINNSLTFLNNKLPIIGISPDTPASLSSFLQHQGYLVDIGSDAQAFSYYLDRASFRQEDERPLLTEIEKGDWPLVRLARWPGTARCALAITGDVDAFTLWDYGRRIWNA
jgi:hypothetical protein